MVFPLHQLPRELQDEIVQRCFEVNHWSLLINRSIYDDLIPHIYTNVNIRSLQELLRFIAPSSGATRHARRLALSLCIDIPGVPKGEGYFDYCEAGQNDTSAISTDAQAQAAAVDQLLLDEIDAPMLAVPKSRSSRRLLYIAKAISRCPGIHRLELSLFSVQHVGLNRVEAPLLLQGRTYEAFEQESFADALRRATLLKHFRWTPPTSRQPVQGLSIAIVPGAINAIARGLSIRVDDRDTQGKEEEDDVTVASLQSLELHNVRFAEEQEGMGATTGTLAELIEALTSVLTQAGYVGRSNLRSFVLQSAVNVPAHRLARLLVNTPRHGSTVNVTTRHTFIGSIWGPRVTSSQVLVQATLLLLRDLAKTRRCSDAKLADDGREICSASCRQMNLGILCPQHLRVLEDLIGDTVHADDMTLRLGLRLLRATEADGWSLEHDTRSLDGSAMSRIRQRQIQLLVQCLRRTPTNYPTCIAASEIGVSPPADHRLSLKDGHLGHSEDLTTSELPLQMSSSLLPSTRAAIVTYVSHSRPPFARPDGEIMEATEQLLTSRLGPLPFTWDEVKSRLLSLIDACRQGIPLGAADLLALGVDISRVTMADGT